MTVTEAKIARYTGIWYCEREQELPELAIASSGRPISAPCFFVFKVKPKKKKNNILSSQLG